LEDEVEDCDLQKVKSLKGKFESLQRKSFKIARLIFNIKNIPNLKMILQGFLKIVNFSRYVLSFLHRFSLGRGLFPPVRPFLPYIEYYFKTDLITFRS
jgi:hypothetical protein